MKRLVLFFPFLVFLFSGCFFPQWVVIRYEVYPDLSGNMSFDLSGRTFQGDEGSEGLLSDVLRANDSLCCFAQIFGLQRFRTSLEMSESDAKLNISLHFDNLPVVLGTLFDKNSEMRRTKNTFSFKCPFELGADSKDSMDVQVRLLYHGKVLNHNGVVDKNTGEIVWTAGKGKSIRFVLKTD